MLEQIHLPALPGGNFGFRSQNLVVRRGHSKPFPLACNVRVLLTVGKPRFTLIHPKNEQNVLQARVLRNQQDLSTHATLTWTFNAKVIFSLQETIAKPD